MTNLQQLESRIRELVPSTAVRLNRCKGCGYGVDYCQKTLACPQFEEHEILQLHHVLQAIVKNNNSYFVPAYKGVSDVINVWNLTRPLSGQSEKTIKLLLEILK